MLKNKYKIFLTIIILASAFLRVYQITSIPPSLYPDEALNANQASEFAFKLFYPENYGREGLFINLISISFLLFGIGLWQLKIVSVFAGTATILGVYLLAKELAKRQNIIKNTELFAVLASLLTAFSFWHISLSRLSFRAVLVPLILSFLFFLLLFAIRKKKTIIFFLAGITFSLGVFSYPAFYPAIILVLYPLFLLYKTSDKKSFAKYLLWFFLPVFISFILFFNYQSQANAFERSSELWVFSSENPIKPFAQNIILTLGQFNIKGDCNPRHNINCLPQLHFIAGLFFVFGIAIVLKNFSSFASSFLLLWLFLFMLPAIFSNEGIPHALRTSGTIIPAYIIASFGFVKLIELLKNKKLGILVLSFAFVFYGAGETKKYFIDFKNSENTKKEFFVQLKKAALIANSYPKDIKIYIVSKGNWTTVKNEPISMQTIYFFAKNKENIMYLNPKNIKDIQDKNSIVIFVQNPNDKEQKTIKNTFKNSKEIKKDDLVIYEIF